MSDHPWYVEWNGIFMPVEDALGNSCLLAIVLMILWLAGFIVYAIVKLTVEAFKAAEERKWGKAFALALVVAFPFLLFGGPIVVSMAAWATEKLDRVVYQGVVELESVRVRDNSHLAYDVERIGEVTEGRCTELDPKAESCVDYLIKNNTILPIWGHSIDCAFNRSDGRTRSFPVRPNESLRVSCPEGAYGLREFHIEFYFVGGWVSAGELCLGDC